MSLKGARVDLNANLGLAAGGKILPHQHIGHGMPLSNDGEEKGQKKKRTRDERLHEFGATLNFLWGIGKKFTSWSGFFLSDRGK